MDGQRADCDGCGKSLPKSSIRRVQSFCGETDQCDACRGVSDDDAGDLLAQEATLRVQETSGLDPETPPPAEE